MWRRCPNSESKGQPGGERKPRTLGRTGEFRADTDIPHDAGRQLVPQADLRPDGSCLATTQRLLGEDVSNQRGTREPRGAHRITRADRKVVAAIALVTPACCEELVPCVEMQAQALDRLRDDSLRLDTEAVRVHAGRRVETELYGERRQCDRLLVEVVERAESEVAGLRPVVEFV